MKKVHICISPPRYRPKDFYTNKMGCQNSYKEAEIENKLSAQSFRSQKSIGENDKKKWNISISTGVRAIKRIFQRMPNTKMTFFTKEFI